MKNVGLFLRLILDPGWAVVLVLGAFVILAPTGLVDRFNWLFHFSGGATACYVGLRCMTLVPALSAKFAPSKRAHASFAFALVIAILWEIAEVCADRWLGTRLNGGNIDTARDLLMGALGACLVSIAGTQRSPTPRSRRT